MAGSELVLFVAKATALLGAGALAALALRRASAGARHLAWLATLAGVLLLPAAVRWSPWRLEVLPRAAGTPATAHPHPAPPASPLAEVAARVPERPVRTESPDGTAPVEGRTTAPPARWLERLTAHGPSWTRLALALWAAGALLAAARALASTRAARRIVAAARPCEDARARALLLELGDRLDLAEPPRLLVSDATEMPFAHGALRPALVLPAHSRAWPEERLRVVLLHELAHVRRRDPAALALARVASAAWWFHPLAWWAERRVRAEAERAADDLVLGCGARPSDYATHLLDILAAARRPGAPAAALAMARARELEGRLVALLDPAVRRGAPGLAARAGVVGALAAVLVTVSAAASPLSVDVVGAAAPVTPIALRNEEAAAPAPAPRPPAPAPTAARPPGQRARKATAKAAEKATEKATEEAAGTATGKASEEERPEQAAARAALLAQVLARDADADVRRAAAWALAGGDSARAADALAAALRGDADEEVREMAAWTLSGVPSPAAGAALGEALRRDASAEVRRTAAWALGHREDGDARALVAGAADRDPEVREASLWALGQRRDEAAAAAAVRALRDPERDVRLAAAWLLGEVRDPGAASALRAAFDAEQDEEVREAQLRALAFLGTPDAAWLERALAVRDPDLRARAVAMLSGRGPGPWPWPWPWPDPRPMP